MKEINAAVDKHRQLILDTERFIWEHPESNPETGAVHSCGHNAQCAALSIGTNIEIIDVPGYSPLDNDDNMIDIVEEAVMLAIPEYGFHRSEDKSSGSTDMGDLCGIMPVVHPYSAGGAGTGHGKDYRIENPVAACVDCAKMQLGMLLILLSDGGKRAKKVIEEFKPQFASKEEYLAFVDGLNSSGDRIEYVEGETAKVNIK